MEPTLISDVTPVIPTVPWGAISAEMVLFLVAMMVIALEAAGRNRRGLSFVFFGLTVSAGMFGNLRMADNFGYLVLFNAIMAVGIIQFVTVFLVTNKTRLMTATICWLGLFVTLCIAVLQWRYIAPTMQVMSPSTHLPYNILGAQSFLDGFVVLDGMGLFIRIALIVFGMLVIPLSYVYLEARQIHRVEYYPLVLLATVGMALLANTNNLIMMFIALEIFSLALYILTALAKRDEYSQEAAVKYFIMGGGASATFLYGAALMYGLSGTMVLSKIVAPLQQGGGFNFGVVAGLIMMAAGLSFKVGIVPFHLWMPDVYQGAPTPVTAFMAAATKAAAFTAFMRVFAYNLGWLQWTWMPMIGLLTAITMLVGAIGALLQQDLKRILGYSAIAHAGYIGLALMATSYEGRAGYEAVASMNLYLFLYGITVIGAFGLVGYLERRDQKALAIKDLAGLGRTNPGVAATFTFLMLGLAGIPTTAGFIGKFAVFRAAYLGGQGVLVGIAIITSVIAAAFYLRIIAPMWMEQADVNAREYPVMSLGETFSLGIITVMTIVFGLIPGLLVALAQTASSLATTS